MSAPESFQTARLEAEKLAPEHLADLQALHREPETMRYLSRNLNHWATHGFGAWMLRLPANRLGSRSGH